MAEKAEIHLLDKKGKKQEGKKPIKVMYNPTGYTFSEAAELKKMKSGKLKFKKMSRSPLTVSLFFDTCEENRDVREETIKIANLVKPAVSGKKKTRPNICLFAWGGFTYRGVITKVDQKFTLFNKDGVPVRADLTVTFTSFESQEDLKKQLGLEACRKLWTVKSGDRLDLIAHTALLDANQWRKIAEINNIVDPLTFPQESDIGKTIVIPDIY